MTEEQIQQFQIAGRNYLTSLAIAARQLAELAEAFEQRGGQPAFGDDALFIVFLSNDLQTWLTPERRAIIARLRTDI